MGHKNSKQQPTTPQLEHLTLTNMPFHVGASSNESRGVVRFVCISDTHNIHDTIQVPQGDVLVIAGDFTNWRTSSKDLVRFNDWLGELPHPHKVIISGNHEVCIKPKDVQETKDKLYNATYLQDELVNIAGVNIYGSPWQPNRGMFKRANAFQSSEVESKWAEVPEYVDILLTHVPPFGILDCNHKGRSMGCANLLTTSLNRRPLVHIFGHNHDMPGACQVTHDQTSNTLYINASQMVNRRPIVFDYYLWKDSSDEEEQQQQQQHELPPNSATETNLETNTSHSSSSSDLSSSRLSNSASASIKESLQQHGKGETEAET